MKIYNTKVFGFEEAIRGMRNPMNSWDRSDSIFSQFSNTLPIKIGPEDLKLMKKLYKAGSEHSKFLRAIQIWVSFELPLYIYRELDTYKVGTVCNSCSTMHKLGTFQLTEDDFQDQVVLPCVLDYLNMLARAYQKTKNFRFVREMKQILPCSYIQRADMNFSYAVALNMFNQRKNHKLSEWAFNKDNPPNSSICNWVYSLPYMKELIDG
jgi:hypothetical protein